ncbi:MAG TPA: glycosyltransferase family 2 protein, partial [Urbifossiella sp.]|nr:glycosyltransferase family 2 protein [Urbifossiella sp.]
VAGGLVPGDEFLPFDDTDLDDVLGRVLADGPRRRAVAAAGQARAESFTTAVLWDRAVAALGAEWDEVSASASARGHMPTPWDIRHWQALSTRPADAAPGPAGETAGERLAAAALAGGAADRFRELLADAAAAVPAALHLAEALEKSGEGRLAAPALRRAIEALNGPEELSPLTRGIGPLRPGFDAFRVEWERAGWENAGDPAAEERAKRALLRARCELLLGRATDDPARVVRAAAAAPTLLPVRRAAAAAATRIGATDQAVELFTRAAAEEPFDPALARGLEDALRRAGDADGLARLRRTRERLAAAAPGSESAPAAEPRRQRVSLTMIVRDEEANLGPCLDAVRDLVDEIVVVDTGSADRTPEVAAARGARVVTFPWRDDFAAARNVGLDAARGDWIFWLDADERLGPADRDKARALFAGLRDENAAYMMRQLSPAEGAAGATTAVDQVRLFRRRPDVRWEYRIHEQILLAVRRTRAAVRPTDVTILHHGYQSAGLRDRKLDRNTRLLELAHREQPADPVLAFNLAWVYHKAGRPADALPLLEFCRRVLRPRVSIVPKVYRLLGQTLGRLGRPGDADAAFAAGRGLYPDDIELLLHHGLLLQRRKDYPAAEACFRRIL